MKVLREKGVQIEAKPPDESPWYITFLVTWGPFVLFLGLWFFLMRQMQIGGNKALSFGKSRARMLTEERKKVTFSDVAGIDEAKEEVLEIIEFLKDPRKFQKLGGRIPKGCADRRSSGDRKNPVGQSHRRGGRRAVLQHQRVRFRRNVRRRRSVPRARSF